MSLENDLVAEARTAIADLARRIREKSDVELVLAFAQLERPTEALRDELVKQAPKKKTKRAARAVPPPVAAPRSKPEGEVAKSAPRPTRDPSRDDEIRHGKIVAHLRKSSKPQAPHEIANALKLSKWRTRRDLQSLREADRIVSQGNKRSLRFSAPRIAA
jgi:hypothetical protein